MTALRARILPEGVPPSVPAGGTFEVFVRLQNRGDAPWPAAVHPEHRRNVTLGNHWKRRDGTLVALDDARAPLAFDLAPGEDTGLVIAPTAPDTPGGYFLDFDLVQEGVTWFETQGSPTARFPVQVVPPGDATSAPVPSPFPQPELEAQTAPAGGETARRPFRERHPRSYEWLRRLGVAAAYRRLRGRPAEPPPVAPEPPTPPEPPAIPANGDWQPVMEMNCVTKPEILTLLVGQGARVMDVELHTLPGFRSFRYWVLR